MNIYGFQQPLKMNIYGFQQPLKMNIYGITAIRNEYSWYLQTSEMNIYCMYVI